MASWLYWAARGKFFCQLAPAYLLWEMKVQGAVATIKSEILTVPSSKRLNILCQLLKGSMFCHLAFLCKPYERHLGFIKLQEANFFCRLAPALAYFHWEMEVQDSGSNGNKKIRSFNCTKQQEAKYSLLSLEREHFGFSNLQEAIFYWLVPAYIIERWKFREQWRQNEGKGRKSMGTYGILTLKMDFYEISTKIMRPAKFFSQGGVDPHLWKFFMTPP